MTPENGSAATASRPVLFARHARAAIERHVPEARTPGAHWSLGTNEAWVRYQRADGFYGYLALRRHLDWVSGEAGVSREPCELGHLVRLPGPRSIGAPGYRMRLGELLGGEDRWWPTGDTEPELRRQLDHLALTLAVKGKNYFRRWPGGEP